MSYLYKELFVVCLGIVDEHIRQVRFRDVTVGRWPTRFDKMMHHTRRGIDAA